MTHDELVAALERERVSYPDLLEAERYAPEKPPPCEPITPAQAAENYAALKQIADREGAA
jgi:hypothetical protein